MLDMIKKNLHYELSINLNNFLLCLFWYACLKREKEFIPVLAMT